MDCKSSLLDGWVGEELGEGRREMELKSGSDGEFIFGPVWQEMPIRLPRGDVKETAGSLSLEVKQEVCYGDTVLRLCIL